jgi:hypothetical protein
MSRHDVRLTFATVAIALLAAAAVIGAPGEPSMASRWEVLGLAAVLGACMQLRIEVVGSPPTSIATAVAIAYAALLVPSHAAAAVAVGIALAVPPLLVRTDATVALDMAAWMAVASAAGLAVVAPVRPLIVEAGAHGQVGELLRVMAAGAGFLAVDVGVRRWAARRIDGERMDPRPPATVMGVHLAMLCAAALLALSETELGPWAALVAAAPLLVIDYSFGRYAQARRTYEQAVRALSVIPEVAGLAQLGHGERTAVYANALTRALDVEAADAELIVTAARLHHIGDALDGETPTGGRRRPPGSAATEMLAEFGFLAGVAEVVAGVDTERAVDLRAAVVRVASSFDELVGDDAANAGYAAVGLLARHDIGIERSLAVSLVQVCDSDPELVHRAIREGR